MILWQESFLSGAGLIAGTEANLWRGCFGAAAAKAFRRDIRALKAFITRAGFSLRFSRRAGRSGYDIVGRLDLAPELAELNQAGMRDVDPKQIELAARLTLAKRVRHAGQFSDGLRRIAVRRLLAERPGLSLQKAHHEVARRYD
jgi:hypothetical protein